MYEDSEEDESSTVFDLNFCAKQLLSVYLPVTVCIVFVSGSVWTLRSCQEDFLNDHLQQIILSLLPFEGEDILKTIGNTLSVFCLPLILLVLLVFTYKKSYEKYLKLFLILDTSGLISLSFFCYVSEVLETLAISISLGLLKFIAVGFGISAAYVLRCGAPEWLQQVFQVSFCGLVALMLLRLPDSMLYCILICLPFYDIYAVLSESGPIRKLKQVARKFDFDHSMISSVAYSSTVQKSIPKEQSGEELEFEVIRLGLGDIVFFSVLCGLSAQHGDLMLVMGTAVAVLFGLLLSAIRLEITTSTVPAMPVSIILGLLIHCGFRQFVSSFAHQLEFHVFL